MNKIVLMGRLVKEPKCDIGIDLDNAWCLATLAVNRTKEVTDFINLTFTRRNAEVLNKFAVKGGRISIVGKLNIKKLDPIISDGKKFYLEQHKIQVSELEIIDFKDQNKVADDEVDKTDYKFEEISF